MSDTIDDLAKRFEEDMRRDCPERFGLFPIPEFPEYESGRGMLSAALDVILTTLRYLTPATLLTIFWGQQSFLFRLLKSIDSAFRAIVFSSEAQKQEILQWLAEAGLVQVEHLDTVWRHGWILCGVLDAALPGTCRGHPPTRLSLKHAQTIADHYLGVEPVFSRQELESSDCLSRHQEWKLATYLDRIRKALGKLSPPVSKPTSQNTSPETAQFTFDYVARGAGLTAAQINNKMNFKIYPTSQQSLDPGDITILIRGPKDTYGMTVIPPILGKAQLIRQKLLGLQSKQTYTESALPLTQGATYLRNFGKNDMSKTYHIPKAKYDIEIEVDMQADHAKIGYIVTLEGKYEISLTSRGQNIAGSPFSMTASNNFIRILEKDSFCLEDGEEIDIVDVKSDRKVVLRIVDFITEKMLLRENGTLEKITDDEANILMSTENISSDFSDLDSRTCSVTSTTSDDFKMKPDKFNKAACKVVQMNRVCKIINSLLAEKKKKEKAFIRPRSQQSIPDIVNSTFSESNVSNFTAEKRDKYIVPENISVSLRTEIAKSSYETEMKTTNVEGKTALNSHIEYAASGKMTVDSLEQYENVHEQNENDALLDKPKPLCNPFLNEIYEQNYAIEKDLGSFVTTEYETNKSQNEETEGTPIKIFVEKVDSTPSPTNTNPFVEPDIIILERPKTPVLKIITGDIKDRSDSLFVDPKIQQLITEDMLSNEFVNPFFLLRHQEHEQIPVTDFIIGAPVSLPPIIRASTPEPEMKSILITAGIKDTNDKYGAEERPIADIKDKSSSVFSTPLHTSMNKLKESYQLENDNTCSSSTFYSLGSNGTDNVEILNLSNVSDNQEIRLERDETPKKDIWDSAYVSIDDNNSSPDSNNNDNNSMTETPSKQKFSLSDTDYRYANMGPAERELWETCHELGDKKICQETKPKLDVARPIFTPILEESDRSMSTGTKDVKSECGPLAVTVAFAELNKIYHDFFTSDETDSPALTQSKDFNYTADRNDKSVNSASALPDVKRHAENQEGKISEVQANVTESASVSQILRKTHLQNKEQINGTEFGDNTKNNIVLEKKQYWDERIREIQAKSTEEDKTHQRRRRLSAQHLRHNDSLTRRRGKQIVKNFLCSTEQGETKNKPKVKDTEIVNRKSPLSSPDHLQSDEKLVEKWKNYWDNKLQSEQDETEISCFRSKSPRSKESSVSPQHQKYSNDDLIEAYNVPLKEKSNMPGKQELPEEVFKAFETSPKRFFGTSRKQILNKIDTFLGKPSTADESSPDLSGAGETYDTGLVSSRISLFHTMSNTEELPWARRKCHSMQNIFQRKDSEQSVTSVNEIGKENTSKENFKHQTSMKKPRLEKKSVTIETEAFEESAKEQIPSLKAKRGRIVQSAFNKTFDESVYKKPHSQIVGVQEYWAKKTIREHEKTTTGYQRNHSNGETLRKSSVSKSEMDIFTKITNKPIKDDLDKYKSCDELPKTNVKNFISLYESVSKKDDKKPIREIRRTRSLGLKSLSISSSSTGAVNEIGSTFSASKFNYTAASETDESTTELTPSPLNPWNKDPESMSSGSYEPRSLDSVDHMVSSGDPEKQTTYVSLSDIELEIVENINKPVKNTEKREGLKAVLRTESFETPEEKAKVVEKEKTTEITGIDYKSRFKMAKQFFQSLEDLSVVKKPKKLNECELLLLSESSESTESLDKKTGAEERPQKRVKKNIKSHSMPSSEISKYWYQLQESRKDASKLVKISEKFNIDDLFNDVMEGRLSRQGSLRGIPHKKAVLEAFRSMENLADNKLNSYEFATSQLTDFANENHIKNAQTYLSEYPYLPTTDPSKYHSRLDAKATGLISLKELHSQKPRRNSVPDLRLNPSFTVQL